MKKINEIRKLVLYNWKPLVGFELIYKFASVILFVPLLWGIFDLIMTSSGYAYLTIENIRSFLEKPLTVFLLLLLLILATTYAMIDISAVIFILDQSKQKNHVHLLQVLKFSVRNALRAWSPRNFLLVLVVLLFMPFLNIGMASSVLTTISIPEFILEYIQTNPLLTILLVLATLLVTTLIIRWLYAFHYFTLEGCSFHAARKKSRVLGKGTRIRDFLTLLFVQLISTALYFLFVFAAVALAAFVTKLFADLFVLRWMISTLIWMILALSVAIAAALAMPVSYGCISVLYYRHKEKLDEPILYSEAPPYYKNEQRARLFHRCNMVLGCLLTAGGFLLGFLLCSGRLNPQIEYIRTTEITAHRGASAYYPENTMAAFEGAKKLGADWIELDVQQTKDGKIIVLHDTNLRRTTGVNAHTWDMTYEEIARLDAGSFFDAAYAGEKIPLLSEVALFAKQNRMKLNIELKPTGHEKDFEKDVIDIIRQTELEDSCVITSQVYEVLERVKAYDPSVTTVYVMSLAYGNINRLAAADHFSIESTSATKSLISRVHNAGKQIYVWTVNTEENITRMIELNVDNIITDDIELAKQCVYESRYSNLLEEYLKLFQ